MTANHFDPEKVKAAWKRIIRGGDEIERGDWSLVEKAIAALSRRPDAGKLVEGIEIFESIVGWLQADDVWPHIFDGHAQDLNLALNWFRNHKADALTALSSAPVDAGVDDEEEAFQIGLRDGRSDAVREIDLATGGDGEYRYCTDHDPERHCPDADTMKIRIIERFDTLSLQLTTERQAMEKVRAEIEWHANNTYPDLAADAYRKALAILAQHMPQKEQGEGQ